MAGADELVLAFQVRCGSPLPLEGSSVADTPALPCPDLRSERRVEPVVRLVHARLRGAQVQVPMA